MKKIITDDKIRQELKRILARREFTSEKTDRPVMDAFSNLLDKIYEWFRNHFRLEKDNPLNSWLEHARISEGTLMALKIAGIIILAVIIILILRLIAGRLYINKKIAHEEMTRMLSVLKNPGEIFNLVDEYLGKDDFQNALRYLYIAMLLVLNRKGIIRVDKSKTNHQYVLEASKNQPLLESDFKLFTQIFNSSWYGGKPLNREIFDRWHGFYQNWAGENDGE